jgi:hypothetical protein
LRLRAESRIRKQNVNAKPAQPDNQTREQPKQAAGEGEDLLEGEFLFHFVGFYQEYQPDPLSGLYGAFSSIFPT